MRLLLKRIYKGRSGYLFILPQFLLFAVFMVYPVISGFRMSFFKISLTKETFVGFGNFAKLFSDEVFIRAIYNTVFFVVAIVLLSIVVGIIIAWSVFDRNPKYVAFIRGCYYIPVVVSMVVMSVIWTFILSPSYGLANYLLGRAGIPPVNFLGDAKLVMPIIVLITFVSSVGEVVVLYIAAMIGISSDVLEAADIDGSSPFQKLRLIIMPLVQPTSMYVLVTKTIAIMKMFAVIQLTTNGGPNHSSTTLMFYLYEKGFQASGKTGEAAAVGVVMFIICLVLSVLQYLLVNGKTLRKGRKSA